MPQPARPEIRPAASLPPLAAGGRVVVAALLASVTTMLAGPAPAATPGPLVAAAADLEFALEEILQRFRADTGIEPRVAYGSSGNFMRQIASGAPHEIFLSADEDFVLALERQGLTRGSGDPYAIGRIVVFAPTGSPLTPDPQLADLSRRLADGSLGRFAIANPEHAPYGRAAEQALRTLGLWDGIQPRLVLGENVAQAARFAGSGDAEGGIIALSLALAPQLRQRGTFALIPQALHRPLRQRMVLLRGASPDARRFYEYLRSPAAREILARYGFVLPDE